MSFTGDFPQYNNGVISTVWPTRASWIWRCHAQKWFTKAMVDIIQLNHTHDILHRTAVASIYRVRRESSSRWFLWQIHERRKVYRHGGVTEAWLGLKL